jgi:hypothetical protein
MAPEYAVDSTSRDASFDERRDHVNDFLSRQLLSC